MSNLQQDLEDIDERIVETEAFLNQADGSLETHRERLKTEFNLTETLAGKEVTKLEKQIITLGTKLDEKYSALVDNYEW